MNHIGLECRTPVTWLRNRTAESGVKVTMSYEMVLNIVEGDLLDQKVDAIVNTWNRNVIPWWLLWPQGVSGAIKRRAGLSPFRELGYRPLSLGDARLTSAGRLPFKGIIHVAGIDLLWRASPHSVAQSAISACELAHGEGYTHIAIPVIGAGSGGLSEEDALMYLLNALRTLSYSLEVTIVRFKVKGKVGVTVRP